MNVTFFARLSFFRQTPSLFRHNFLPFLMFTSQLSSPKRVNIFNVHRDVRSPVPTQPRPGPLWHRLGCACHWRQRLVVFTLTATGNNIRFDCSLQTSGSEHQATGRGELPTASVFCPKAQVGPGGTMKVGGGKNGGRKAPWELDIWIAAAGVLCTLQLLDRPPALYLPAFSPSCKSEV